jgi:hypothetical protein
MTYRSNARVSVTLHLMSVQRAMAAEECVTGFTGLEIRRLLWIVTLGQMIRDKPARGCSVVEIRLIVDG